MKVAYVGLIDQTTVNIILYLHIEISILELKKGVFVYGNSIWS